MVNKVEIIESHDRLYELMTSSGDIRSMEIYGEAMKNLLEWVAEMHPQRAAETVEELEAIGYKHHLTANEEEIMSNELDGGPHWRPETALPKLESIGLKTDEPGSWNRYALVHRMNMEYMYHKDEMPVHVRLDMTDEDEMKLYHALAVNNLL